MLITEKVNFLCKINEPLSSNVFNGKILKNLFKHTPQPKKKSLLITHLPLMGLLLKQNYKSCSMPYWRNLCNKNILKINPFHC